MDVGIQIAAKEEGLGGKKKECNTKGVDEGDRPESSIVTQMFGNNAPQEDAQTHTNIPRDEDGGVSRASLVIRGYTDGHVLEGGPHVTITQADENGATVVANEREEG